MKFLKRLFKKKLKYKCNECHDFGHRKETVSFYREIQFFDGTKIIYIFRLEDGPLGCLPETVKCPASCEYSVNKMGSSCE